MGLRVALPMALAPAPGVNLAELAYAQFLTDVEMARQREVTKARRYTDGEHLTFLTDRLRQFLDVPGDVVFRLNVCRTVIAAITERMTVKGFESAERETAAWALALWQANRMDAHQGDVHDGVMREGEYFVIVDWDEAAERPRLTPHPRYTEAFGAGGDGFGCKATYVDDDPNQPMRFATKRWTETVGEGNRRETRQRMNVYTPERVLRYVYSGKVWLPLEGAEAEVAWVDEAGQPLGIPVIHFRNKELRSELEDAISVQDAINKSFIDLLAAADFEGFRILFAKGFIPTKDGQKAKDDESNLLEVGPGMTVATTNPEADLKALEGSDPRKMFELVDRLIQYLAVVTDTPTQRFQFSGQIARAETLEEQKEPLFAKIEDRQTRIGNAWEDCLDMARKLTNLAIAQGRASSLRAEPFDLGVEVSTRWKKLQSATVREQKEEAEAKKASGIPAEQIWRDVWGYDEEMIERMKSTDEHQARLGMMKLGMIAGERVRRAEDGRRQTADGGRETAEG